MFFIKAAVCIYSFSVFGLFFKKELVTKPEYTKIIAKKRITWHSKILFLKPHEYVDEMLDGPFKKWRHVHKFRKVDEKQTQVIDEIEFELPYGILGKLFEGYAYKQLQQTFEHRKVATIKALENI